MMLFSEPFFLFFFLPVLLIAYFIVPRFLRNPILLIASLFFYTAGEKLFVLIMLISILINYLVGVAIGRVGKENKKRVFLIIGLVIDIGLLFVFKYANFVVNNINSILSYFGQTQIRYTAIHLPIGISFFTFQAMSYVIDVYRNRVKYQKNPAKIALYISLFPQLIAGPIVRYSDIAYHLDKRTETFNKFSYGVFRFIIGLGKKMIIANTVALPVDRIFNLPEGELKFSLAWYAVICYSLQIYFDFSGYSDMAIGLGRIFGFRFPENFNYPYISKSITEFWRRWHLSLSTWFRDYLYIPLGGNRGSVRKTYLNLLIVFLLCGLWHGASWNFVIWGLFHGFLLIIERIGFGKWLKKRNPILKHSYVLLMVMISWVFFRSNNLTIALRFLSVMFGGSASRPEVRFLEHFINNEIMVLICIGIVSATPVIKRFFKAFLFRTVKNEKLNIKIIYLKIFRILFLILIFVYSILNMASGSYNPFIYFRF